MCVRCVRRHIAGALFDSVTRDPLSPAALASCQRWAWLEADEYVRATFGEL
jgi:hypothetical protein